MMIRLAPVTFLLLLTTFLFSQDMFHPSTLQKFFENGEYKRVVKIARQQRKKLEKKDSDYSAYKHAETYIYEGLSENMLGDISSDSLLDVFDFGLNILDSNYTKKSPEYSAGLLYKAQLFTDYGNFKEAEAQLKNVLSPQNSLFAYSSLFHVTVSNLYLAEAKYNESLLEIEKAIKEFDDHNATIKLNAVKEKKSEVLYRNELYGNLLNIQCEILIKKGDFKNAEIFLSKSKAWLESYVGVHDGDYMYNTYLWGLYYEKLLDYDKASLKYEYLLDHITQTTKGTKYRYTSSFYFKVIDGLSSCLWELGLDQEAARYINEYSPVIKRKFSVNSPAVARLKLLEVKKDLINRDFSDAEEKIELVKSIVADYPKSHPFKKEILTYSYDLYLAQENFQAAETTMAELAEIAKNNYAEASPVMHIQNIEKAKYLLDHTNNIEEAKAIFEKSFLGIVSKQIDAGHSEYFSTYNELAKLYYLQDDFESSKKLYLELENKAKDVFGTEHFAYANQLQFLASLLIEIGGYTEAFTKLSNSQRIFESTSVGVNQKGYGLALQSYAKLYLLLGNFGEAEDKLNEARSVFKKFKENRTEIIEFAELYIRRGEYQKVENILLEALNRTITKYGNDYGRLCEIYNELSTLYLVTGDYADSESYAKKSMDLAEKLYAQTSLRYSRALEHRARVHAAFGDYEGAIKNFEKVLNIKEKLFERAHISVAITLIELGMVSYFSDKDINKALKYLDESLVIIEKNIGSENPTYADALKNKAFLLIENGQLNAADDLLAKAEDIWVKNARIGRKNVNTADILLLRGNIAKSNKDFEKAISFYNKSGAYYKKIFSLYHPKYAYSQSKLGEVYYLTGQHKKAITVLSETTDLYLEFIEKYFPALSEREKSRYWNLIKKDFEFFNTLAYKFRDGNPELVGKMYNNVLSTKALLLSSSIKLREAIHQSNNPGLIEKFDLWVIKYELFISALSYSDEERLAKGIDIKKLEDSINELEKELNMLSADFNNFDKNKVTWQDIRNALADNEVAVEVVRFRLYESEFTDSVIYAALIVDNDITKQQPKVVFLNNGNKLEGPLLNFYKNTIRLDLLDKEAYNEFWKPVYKEIASYKKAYLSLDGVYNQINIETLWDDSLGFLMNKQEMVVLSNTRDILKKKKVENSNYVLLIGNPTFHTRKGDKQIVNQLPGTQKEVSAVAKILNNGGKNAEVLIGDEAKEDVIKMKVNKTSPLILHIATHGYFIDVASTDDESELSIFNDHKPVENELNKSGVLLYGAGDIIAEEGQNYLNYNKKDGILTATECRNWNLKNTKVVVLSACETGLGTVRSGEGVYGLQRSFLEAGAEAVILSLFKVSDEVTDFLLQEMARNYDQNHDIRLSFTMAKKSIMKKYSEPIYWGAFMMMGNN